jgi:predicted RNase H-like nuclease
VATLGPDGGWPEVALVAHFDAVADAVAAGGLAFVAVDMPIGLSAAAPRECDIAARRLLGPRRASVFPTPVRATLSAAGYAEALAASRAACGRGLSRQSYNLLGKIAEVEGAVRRIGQDRVSETHPELAFAALAGAPMAEPKRTAAGLAARWRALTAAFGDPGERPGRRLRGAAVDDVLDACALAWSARRQLAGEGERVGGADDGTGLRMEVCW